MSLTTRISMARSRGWCFTLNHPTGALSIDTLAVGINELEYVIYQLEVGEQGTPHLQGYMHFKRRQSFNIVRNALCAAYPIEGPTFHIEARRGTTTQAIEYCKKAGSAIGPLIDGLVYYEPVIWGDSPVTQGERSDLAVLATLASEGAALIDIAEAHQATFVRYHRGLEHLREIYNVVPLWRDVNVQWIYGPSGSGKSRWASTREPDAYWKESGQWWCGYDGQECVIFDDFRGSFCTFSTFLRWLDGHPVRIQIKHGSARLAAVRVIVTSINPPNECYTSEALQGEPLQQLYRRITSVKSIDADGGIVEVGTEVPENAAMLINVI